MRRNPTDPVSDWLAYYAEFDPRRLAAVDLATQRRLTYGQFDGRSTRLATALRERFGVEHGDRVAFLACYSTDHFETMFACWKLGAIFVPMNWRLSAHETAAILEHCELRVVLHDADLAPLLAFAHAPTLGRVPGHATCGYGQLIAAHEPRVAMEHADFDTINMLLCTRGSGPARVPSRTRRCSTRRVSTPWPCHRSTMAAPSWSCGHSTPPSVSRC